MDQEKQAKPKKKWYFRWWAILIYIFLFIRFIVFISDSQEVNKINTQTNTNSVITVQTVDYDVVDQKDTSYAGCKRTGIWVTFPDDTSQNEADQTLTKIINDNKTSWDSITVWAYKESEKDQVGKTNASFGQKEFSTCK